MATELISAAKRGDLIALRRAVGASDDLNGLDSQGWTALFHASYRGNTEAVKLLIHAGADVNRGIETGFTALFSAVIGQHVETVRLLLEAGAKTIPGTDGIQLRGWALAAEGERRDQLVALLDDATDPSAMK